MRVLVTGCGGFVGRFLTGALDAAGHEVWGIDRADGGSGIAPDRYRSLDLSDRKALTAFLHEGEPQAIVHLAAQSSAGRSWDEPHLTIQNNTLPILHILDYLRVEAPATRLLAIGSADVYGSVSTADMPLTEDRRPNPQNPYALSKAIQEELCTGYAEQFNVDVVSTRSFNHTGAGQSDRFVLPSFARQVAEIAAGKRSPVVRVGNIDIRRDFSSVGDVCRAYVMLLDSGIGGQIYNVCSGVSHSLRELLERLAEIAGVEITIEEDPDLVRPADMSELRGDHAKIVRDTGWRPEITIDGMLTELIDAWTD